MPVNRNALIRYKVIDSCLQRRQRKWTLDDLIDAVSDALYEFDGNDKGISKRTIQSDIQMMRSDKLGYYAPIVVEDKKYYTYSEPGYSITNIPLSETDLGKMNEAVEMLKQFKGFTHFNQLNEVVQKLEDHVYSSRVKSFPVIDFEKNDNLKGLNHLDILYQSVIHKKPVSLTYQSFKARKASTFAFNVWWLKEFKNRWFAVGVKDQKKFLLTLALDRIEDVNISEESYVENDKFNPELYYKHVIGVTVSNHLRPLKVGLFVSNLHAPYVITKPLHSSQELLETREDGMVIQLKVQHNFELEKEILGFGEGVQVLWPPRLQKKIKERLQNAYKSYDSSDIPDESLA